MIPLLVGAVIGGIIADEIISDDVLKKDIKTDKKTEESSKSEASKYLSDEEIAMIEGGGNFSTSSGEHFFSAQECYQAGINYYYGTNGESADYNVAKIFFKMAADAGHFEAKKKLKELF